MGLVRSIKTDPFGVMDTRLTNESYADDLLPIAFAPFHLVRAVQEPSGKIQEADAKRGDGDHELRKSACRFVSDPTYPRLELNAAVDRYHLLDGLEDLFKVSINSPVFPRWSHTSSSILASAMSCSLPLPLAIFWASAIWARMD